MKVKIIAKKIGITLGSAGDRVPRKGFARKWSQKDEKFLIKNYSLMRPAEIAKALDRTTYSVYDHARALKLKSPWHGPGRR